MFYSYPVSLKFYEGFKSETHRDLEIEKLASFWLICDQEVPKGILFEKVCYIVALLLQCSALNAAY